MSLHLVKFWTQDGGPVTVEQWGEDSRTAALRAIPKLTWIGYAEFIYVQVGEGIIRSFLSREFSETERTWAFEQFHEERAREVAAEQRRAHLWRLIWKGLGLVAVFAAGALTYFLWSRR